MDAELKARMLARARAKKFANEVKGTNMAFSIPDDWDEMTDEQIKIAISYLPKFGLVRREHDRKWEQDSSK